MSCLAKLWPPLFFQQYIYIILYVYLLYNIDVIQHGFKLAAVHAPFLHGAKEKCMKKHFEKQEF